MILDRLTELFLKFPGIGPRQAKRFAYFLATAETEYIEELSSLVSRAKSEITVCGACYRTFARAKSENLNCLLCESETRARDILMVVEKDADLEAIEISGAYNGMYFVLGGTVSPSQSARRAKNAPKTRELEARIIKDGKEIKEIILATSATLEGELTSRIVESQIIGPLIISKFPGLKITRLGRGLSTGSELEYSDRDTIVAALGSRK